MTAAQKHQPTPAQRLAALTEKVLADAEQKAATGEPVSARELNGIRRLIDRQEADEAIARANELARG